MLKSFLKLFHIRLCSQRPTRIVAPLVRHALLRIRIDLVLLQAFVIRLRQMRVFDCIYRLLRREGAVRELSDVHTRPVCQIQLLRMIVVLREDLYDVCVRLHEVLVLQMRTVDGDDDVGAVEEFDLIVIGHTLINAVDNVWLGACEAR